MKELVVISGKGGTGKTSIVASFAKLAENAVFADCDVDAADLHLVLEPDIKQTTDFSGGKQARINNSKCIGCGKCNQLCKFGAIKFDGPGNDVVGKTYTVDQIACEGCKVCVEFCPVNAIEFNDSINGQWFISETRFGPMVHAKLGIAEENSGKLVSLIRNEAKKTAHKCGKDLIIVDGSPGIGCPVIASVTGSDIVLVITEPTLSGKHDLSRVIDLASGFNVSVLVAVNKYDLNLDMTSEIEEYANIRNIKVVGRIGYDKAFTKAQIDGKSVVEYTNGTSAEDIKALWQNVTDELNLKK